MCFQTLVVQTKPGDGIRTQVCYKHIRLGREKIDDLFTFVRFGIESYALLIAVLVLE